MQDTLTPSELKQIYSKLGFRVEHSIDTGPYCRDLPGNRWTAYRPDGTEVDRHYQSESAAWRLLLERVPWDDNFCGKWVKAWVRDLPSDEKDWFSKILIGYVYAANGLVNGHSADLWLALTPDLILQAIIQYMGEKK
jgi:hypothetical protein